MAKVSSGGGAAGGCEGGGSKGGGGCEGGVDGNGGDGGVGGREGGIVVVWRARNPRRARGERARVAGGKDGGDDGGCACPALPSLSNQPAIVG